jgi:beta-N-acetylhexosaminidase
VTDHHHPAGERLVFSFKGTALPAHIENWLEKGLCGGIIFFEDNFENTSQFKNLVDDIYNLSFFTPPFLMVDHEGGRVQRIRDPLTLLPPASELASRELKETGYLTELGERVGEELGSLGININLAPVLDVLTEENNRVIGDRAFGSSPEVVARFGMDFARGLLRGGVCPVVKHFPGHGMTSEDSHRLLPLVDMDLTLLEDRHVAPFVYAISKGIPAIMTAHIVYTALDPDLPATLSEKIVRLYLRDKLGFSGVVMSDDTNMKAISNNFSPEEIALLSTEATTDIIINTGSADEQEALVRALNNLYEKTPSNRETIRQIHKRVDGLRNIISALAPRRR